MAINYFELLGLPAVFDIDTDDLTERYRAAARQCHPDRFAAASVFEQKQAALMTAALNDARRVLSDPIERAEHLLAIAGHEPANDATTHQDVEFLMQQMQWREQLDDSPNDPQLDEETAQAFVQILSQIGQSLANRQYETSAELLQKARFIAGFRRDLAARKKETS